MIDRETRHRLLTAIGEFGNASYWQGVSDSQDATASAEAGEFRKEAYRKILELLFPVPVPTTTEPE